MAVLRPSGADVVVSEGTHNTRRYFWIENEYGARVSITSYAFRYRVYIKTKNSSDAWVLTERADVTGTISTAAQGEFYFDFTTAHTGMAEGSYTAELVIWSSGTVTDPPSDRYRGIFTVEGRLEAP